MASVMEGGCFHMASLLFKNVFTTRCLKVMNKMLPKLFSYTDLPGCFDVSAAGPACWALHPSQWSHNLAPRKDLPPGFHCIPNYFPQEPCAEEWCHSALDGRPGLGKGYGSMWRMKSSV